MKYGACCTGQSHKHTNKANGPQNLSSNLRLVVTNHRNAHHRHAALAELLLHAHTFTTRVYTHLQDDIYTSIYSTIFTTWIHIATPIQNSFHELRFTNDYQHAVLAELLWDTLHLYTATYLQHNIFTTQILVRRKCHDRLLLHTHTFTTHVHM